MVKTLIVDDQSLVRQGLEIFLSDDNEIEIVGTAQNGQEALQKAYLLHPEVVLMDVAMPEMDGLEATAVLKKELPAIKVIILTGKLDLRTVNKAVNARADGFLLKSFDKEELCKAVKAAMSGQFLISPQAALSLTIPNRQYQGLHTLTLRETEVLKYVAKGKANKEIARELALSEGTIKTHVSIIMSKLGLQSRTQAALYASEAGLV